MISLELTEFVTYFPIQKLILIDSQGFRVIGQQIGNKTVIIKGKQRQNLVNNQND